MSDIPSCGQTCTHSCSTPCGGIGEALDRFNREAVRGVCDTGRYRCRHFTWGDGPPLLFIHGLTDSSQAFLPTLAHLSPWPPWPPTRSDCPGPSSTPRWFTNR